MGRRRRVYVLLWPLVEAKALNYCVVVDTHRQSLQQGRVQYQWHSDVNLVQINGNSQVCYETCPATCTRHADSLVHVTAAVFDKYQQLLQRSVSLAKPIRAILPEENGKWGQRVGLYLTPGAEYITATWGTWLAGGIVVPLCQSHTQREIEYVIQDAAITLVLISNERRLEITGLRQLDVASIEASTDFEIDRLPSPEQGALIIYTSGTTGRPKGVLHTHNSLNAQMWSLSQAWGWSENDVLLHALPLHHIHGIVNALYTAHYNGACVKMLPKFSPATVWSAIQDGRVSLFMGVPTMYSHLLSFFDTKLEEEQRQLQRGAELLRLYVSGSSACPVSIMKRWKDITSHWLLERYGMTEIGMALSNPLQGERRPGFVGTPLPGVIVKTAPTGELLVKGTTIFSEYWSNPKATTEAFDEEGYFKTGDIVTTEGMPPLYRILGRQSVDIIKSGGYRLSALEIESVLLEHPNVKECSVIGYPDKTYGEIVTAVICTTSGETPDLIAFCAERLAQYKIPKKLIRIDRIPRNTMGKSDVTYSHEMRCFRYAEEMRTFSRELRREGKRIGFVPTMGHLHEGHLSLIQIAKQHSNVIIASIYVNPTQFAANEDFDAYPLSKEQDHEKLRIAGCDVVFEPHSLYSHKDQIDSSFVIGAKPSNERYQTFVSVEALEKPLCGITRPHFFRGVATVVTKLFNIVEPDVAVFGLKDYQQFQVVKTFTRELNFDIEIIGGPVVREEDGLAMSSRNALLHPDVRSHCTALYQGLHWAQRTLHSNTDNKHTPHDIISAIESRIVESGGKVDYVKIVDPETLQDIENLTNRDTLVIAVAAFYKNRKGVLAVRLIDNILIELPNTP